MAQRRAEFADRGHKERHFFPHRVIRLPKPGPDGVKLAERMCGPIVLEQLWELVLYALPPALDEFPADVFFDDDIIWHEQQFGLPGQVASVNLVVQPPDVYAMVLVSDLVQRIGRRRTLKTRVENRFAGWSRLLVHAALDFALDQGLSRVLVPTADLALEHTDPDRLVRRGLFDRIYDGGIGPPFVASRRGAWWELDVSANAPSLVRPEVSSLPLTEDPVVCICHDIERGWGHRGLDAAFAAAADREAPGHLRRMLELEAEAGLVATYSVVGAFLPEVRTEIESAGHRLAFHSYDHAVPPEADDDQLARCRQVDYRLKGYRPPQSRLTDEVSEPNLAFHNFEWLASSRHSLGIEVPELRDAVVYVPIAFDDFDLHQGVSYEDWLGLRLPDLVGVDRAAFSLHDCYAEHWLPGYRQLLHGLQELACIRTIDQVAADVLLGESV